MTLLTTFWDEIRDWLNNTAADVVQERIGYDARKALQKAVNHVDRIMNVVRNTSQVYYRQTPLSSYYDKVVLETSAPEYEFDEELLKTLENEECRTMEMECLRWWPCVSSSKPMWK